jgi:zinc transporter 9
MGDNGSLRRNSSMETLTFVPSNEEAAANSASKVVAFPLTLGLVMHALADGLALGVASLTTSSPGSAREGAPLSIVVFLALLVHKAPTALALTTSLLAASLPRQDCKKHLLVFSLSTPLGAMFTFAIFSVLGSGQQGQGLDALAGSALLVSGGTFLYVATVLQPVSHQEGNDVMAESDSRLRVVFVVVGMFLPFLISIVLGHGHGH